MLASFQSIFIILWMVISLNHSLLPFVTKSSLFLYNLSAFCSKTQVIELCHCQYVQRKLWLHWAKGAEDMLNKAWRLKLGKTQHWSISLHSAGWLYIPRPHIGPLETSFVVCNFRNDFQDSILYHNWSCCDHDIWSLGFALPIFCRVMIFDLHLKFKWNCGYKTAFLPIIVHEVILNFDLWTSNFQTY